MSIPPSVTIIKLGGSLMDLHDLRSRLLRLISSNTENNESIGRVLIIPGGGAAADEIRRLDRLASLTPEQSHRAAIDAMSSNAAVLARTFGHPFDVVRSRAEANRAWDSARIPILCPATFLVEEERNVEPNPSLQFTSSKRLPASWDVTSDSIAAWIAHRWPASRLILAKSANAPDGNISNWARNGSVDPGFESLSHDLQVCWANLRDND